MISPTGSWPRIRGNGPGKSERLMDVGVADAAGMHLHEHLIRSGLRLRNVFDLPRTAHSGNDGGLHITLPPSAIRCERLCGRCMNLDARQSDTQAEVDDHWVSCRPLGS